MYKVFLVDDEPFILDGLKDIINWQDHGFEIAGQAQNGLEALNALSSMAVKPDIVITDITMPEMDGLTLIQRLKTISPMTKYIILSGYNEFEFVKKGIALGIENYLLKPVNVQEMLLTLANTREKLEYIRYREINEKRANNILKDNLLYRWVTNRISAMELKERASVLQIRLDYPYFLACIVKISPEDAQEDQAKNAWEACFTNVYDLLCAYSGKHESLHCFSNYDGEITLIWGAGDEEGSKTDFLKILEDIRRAMAEVCPMEFFITVGDMQKGFAGLHKSYENARRIQEYRLLSEPGKIYTYDEADRDQHDEFESPADFKQLLKLQLSKDREALFLYIDQVFDAFSKRPGIKPSCVLNLCIELIIHIDKTAENLGHSQELSSNYWEIFGAISEANTLDQLKKLVKDAASRVIDQQLANDQKMSPVIRQVLNLIHKNYTGDLSLKTLGYEMNINPVYLGQLFQKETGTLFNEYVNRLRMQNAMQLLLNTNLKAIDVSRKAGFTDPNYFFRQFKKYYGVSPTEFRASRCPIQL